LLLKVTLSNIGKLYQLNIPPPLEFSARFVEKETFSKTGKLL